MRSVLIVNLLLGPTAPGPVGQRMANLRRKGTKNSLGKDPERAELRAVQLAAIDPDWDCPWPLNCQRHYRVLADLVDADSHLPDIAPGVLMDGDDIGKWLQQQRKPGTWRSCRPNSSSGCRSWACGPTRPRLPPRQPRARRSRARHSRRSSPA